MSESYIFIDTCTWYDIVMNMGTPDSDRFLEEIFLINSSDDYSVLFSQQLHDELIRNLGGKWGVRWIENETKPISKEKTKLNKHRDDLSGKVTDYDGIDRAIAEIDNLLQGLSLQEKDVELRWENKMQVAIEKVDKLQDELSRIEINSDVYMKSEQRKIRGNPPEDRKNDDKVCDRIHWESLLSHFQGDAVEEKSTLIIISDNKTDWCGYDGVSLHPYLRKEFEQTTHKVIEYYSEKSKIPELSAGLKQALEEQERKSAFIDQLSRGLSHARSFSEGKKALKDAIDVADEISAEDTWRIIDACFDNNDNSYGPHNQVTSNSDEFYSLILALYRSDDARGLDTAKWKNVYLRMSRNQQEHFISLRRALENKGVEFDLQSLRYLDDDDVPF